MIDMSNIPMARQMLVALAEDLPDEQRDQLLDIVRAFLFRETPVRRVAPKSRGITAWARREIHRLGNSEMPIHEIASRLGMNPGRVSEVLNGKR
jgi:hypothetical protein